MSAMATHFSLRLLPFLLLLLPVLSNAQPQQVIYSWPMSMLGDARGSYPIALLHLAIEKSGTEYKLVPNGQVMSQHRTVSVTTTTPCGRVVVSFSTAAV